MYDVKAAKARWRREALARRDALAETARIEASLDIAVRLEAELVFEPGAVISGFLPIRSEVDLRPAMAMLADRGARLCLPAIVDGEIEFRQLLRGAALEPQGFGTYAPGPDAAVLAPDIMLVPLAAFDRDCGRIGYGSGYYDKAIAALRDVGLTPNSIGIAFAVQEIDAVPTEAHDVALDVIVTEAELLRR